MHGAPSFLEEAFKRALKGLYNVFVQAVNKPSKCLQKALKRPLKCLRPILKASKCIQKASKCLQKALKRHFKSLSEGLVVPCSIVLIGR
jgi:glycerate-2-kinase